MEFIGVWTFIIVVSGMSSYVRDVHDMDIPMMCSFRYIWLHYDCMGSVAHCSHNVPHLCGFCSMSCIYYVLLIWY